MTARSESTLRLTPMDFRGKPAAAESWKPATRAGTLPAWRRGYHCIHLFRISRARPDRKTPIAAGARHARVVLGDRGRRAVSRLSRGGGAALGAAPQRNRGPAGAGDQRRPVGRAGPALPPGQRSGPARGARARRGGGSRDPGGHGRERRPADAQPPLARSRSSGTTPRRRSSRPIPPGIGEFAVGESAGTIPSRETFGFARSLGKPVFSLPLPGGQRRLPRRAARPAARQRRAPEHDGGRRVAQGAAARRRALVVRAEVPAPGGRPHRRRARGDVPGAGQRRRHVVCARVRSAGPGAAAAGHRVPGGHEPAAQHARHHHRRPDLRGPVEPVGAAPPRPAALRSRGRAARGARVPRGDGGLGDHRTAGARPHRTDHLRQPGVLPDGGLDRGGARRARAADAVLGTGERRRKSAASTTASWPAARRSRESRSGWCARAASASMR